MFSVTKFHILTHLILKTVLQLFSSDPNLGKYKPCFIDASLIVCMCIIFMGVKKKRKP